MKLAIVGIIALAAIGIALGPVAAIWALNTLFGLSIPLTLKTWAAALLLCVMVESKSSRGGKS